MAEERKIPSTHLDPEHMKEAMLHYIYMLSEICQRDGMGQKLIKNHLILHLHEYIKLFGPPTGWDSGPSERHHKTQVKVPAKNTQRRQISFIEQTAHRFYEAIII